MSDIIFNHSVSFTIKDFSADIFMDNAVHAYQRINDSVVQSRIKKIYLYFRSKDTVAHILATNTQFLSRIILY